MDTKEENNSKNQNTKKSLFKKHFPTFHSHWNGLNSTSKKVLKFIAIIIVLIAIPLTVFFTQKQQNINTNANRSFVPFSITSDPYTKNVTTSNATVGWFISDYGTGQVQYGVNPTYGLLSTPENSFVTRNHNQILSNLLPNTTYHFRVISTSRTGYTVISPDYTFSTSGVVVNSPTPAAGNSPTPTKASSQVAGPTLAQAASCNSSLQNAIDNAASGSILNLTGCTYLSGATVNKSLTIIGGTINVPSGGKGLTVTANNVTIDGIKIVGINKTTFNGNEYGIYASGPSNLTVKNSNIGVFGYSSFYGNANTNLTITNNTFYDDVYAGIMVISGTGGVISNNNVSRIGVVGYETKQMNSYGIALTDTGGVPTTGFTVSGNTVDNVPQWHGIDTHGGRNLVISSNIIHRTNRAIFITDSANGGAQNITISSNTADTPTRRVDVSNTYPYNEVGITVVSGSSNVSGSNNKLDGWPSGNAIDTQGGPNNFTNSTITNSQ